MLTVVLTAALAAQPKVGVHLATALKVSPQRQDETIAFLSRTLHAGGLEVHETSAVCGGVEACVLDEAKQAGLDAVVLVTLGPAGAALAVDLDALRVKDA